MLHRDIVDQDTLKMLLKSLDIMPYWRDRLIQLSYNPLAINAVGDWIKNVYDKIRATISSIITGIKEGFAVGIQSLVEFIKSLWEKILKLIDTLFDMSIESLQGVFINIFKAQAGALEEMAREGPD
ncbi:hypothetical protein ES705_50595 [subsurface metagenome]